MSLQDQAKAFRETFNQECAFNISHYGMIKQRMWICKVLIEEEAAEFIEAAGECFADPRADRRTDLIKEFDLVFVCYQFAAAFNPI